MLWHCAGFSVSSHMFLVFPVYSLGWICAEECVELLTPDGKCSMKFGVTERKRAHHCSPINFCRRLCWGQICSDMKEKVQHHFSRVLNRWIKARLVSNTDHNVEYCFAPSLELENWSFMTDSWKTLIYYSEKQKFRSELNLFLMHLYAQCSHLWSLLSVWRIWYWMVFQIPCYMHPVIVGWINL